MNFSSNQSNSNRNNNSLCEHLKFKSYIPAMEFATVNMIPMAPPNSGPRDLEIM